MIAPGECRPVPSVVKQGGQREAPRPYTGGSIGWLEPHQTDCRMEEHVMARKKDKKAQKDKKNKRAQAVPAAPATAGAAGAPAVSPPRKKG